MAKIDRGPSRNMDDLSREDKSESGDRFLGLKDVCPSPAFNIVVGIGTSKVLIHNACDPCLFISLPVPVPQPYLDFHRKHSCFPML